MTVQYCRTTAVIYPTYSYITRTLNKNLPSSATSSSVLSAFPAKNKCDHRNDRISRYRNYRTLNAEIPSADQRILRVDHQREHRIRIRPGTHMTQSEECQNRIENGIDNRFKYSRQTCLNRRLPCKEGKRLCQG